MAEYCRRKGLYPEQIQQWRDEFMQPDQREERALIKKQQKEIQQLNREIARKDKALAEAAALLILEKNWRRSSPKNARTNDTHGRQVTTDGCGAGSP
ncbi:MAG: transposase [Klebsiella michiganensis]|uniref:transposase n=1 Tax=Klebsiella michiganensis TaxID=1134687 RepID=UPI0030A543FD